MPICGPSITTTLEDFTQVGEARRKSALLAERLGFDAESKARLELVVTEAGTNVIKHGGGGVMLLQSALRAGGGPSVEVLALDKGRGIADVARSMNDGYSTSGTQGTGLGAIRRQSQFFDIYSQPGKGTAVLAIVHAPNDDRGGSPAPFMLGAVQSTLPGEDVCGDRWAWFTDGLRLIVGVADGLGHGREAAKAAEPAVEGLRAVTAGSGPLSLLREVHGRIRHTRGAALSICELSLATGKARFAGVGNVAGLLTTGASDAKDTHLVSMNGTLGHVARSFQEFTYDWPERGFLVLHSDGVSGRWRMSDYPGLVRKHPALVAGVLFRDHYRGRDDGTVVVVKRA